MMHSEVKSSTGKSEVDVKELHPFDMHRLVNAYKTIIVRSNADASDPTRFFLFSNLDLPRGGNYSHRQLLFFEKDRFCQTAPI